MAFGAALLGLLKSGAGMAGKGLLQGGINSLLGNIFGGGGDTGPRLGTADEIRQSQARTQELVDKNINLSEALMDPNSAQNQMMRNMMTQRASQAGAQTGNQAMKMAAMQGVSPGQALMAQRQAQNQAMGGVNEQFQNAMQGRFSQGLGLNTSMIGTQQALDENIGQLHLANRIGAMNAQQPSAGAGSGIIGQIPGLQGLISGIGSGEGFMGNFGTGQGFLANLFGGGNSSDELWDMRT